jgi:hypothetical protein
LGGLATLCCAIDLISQVPALGLNKSIRDLFRAVLTFCFDVLRRYPMMNKQTITICATLAILGATEAALAAGVGTRVERRHDAVENTADRVEDKQDFREQRRDCVGDGPDCRSDNRQDKRHDTVDRAEDRVDDRRDRR